MRVLMMLVIASSSSWLLVVVSSYAFPLMLLDTLVVLTIAFIAETAHYCLMMLYFMHYSSNFGLGLEALMVSVKH